MGQTIIKCGNQSGLTSTTLGGVLASVVVERFDPNDNFSSRFSLFTNQYRTVIDIAFGIPGDSGSVIVNTSYEPMGIIGRKQRTTNIVYFSKMSLVKSYNHLGFDSIVTS